MARGPQRQVCKLCALDDDEYVSWEVEAPGLWRYTCTNPSHREGYSWLTTGKDPLAGAGHDGLSNDLGIYEDLLACFTIGERFVEYGVVEHRYAVANPGNYKHIVGLYSHTGFGDHVEYSASAFIGSALGKLGREGLLVRRPCRATGFWKYNGLLNAWALQPGPDGEEIVTWEAYAEGIGVDPGTWPRSLLT
jgi:hypothetical protein